MFDCWSLFLSVVCVCWKGSGWIVFGVGKEEER